MTSLNHSDPTSPRPSLSILDMHPIALVIWVLGWLVGAAAVAVFLLAFALAGTPDVTHYDYECPSTGRIFSIEVMARQNHFGFSQTTFQVLAKDKSVRSSLVISHLDRITPKSGYWTGPNQVVIRTHQSLAVQDIELSGVRIHFEGPQQ